MNMLNLFYCKAESNILPLEVDVLSSPTTVFLRKNIKEEERIDLETKERKTIFVYEEAKISQQKYNNYIMEKNQADIAYLSMIMGVEYDE